MGDIKRLSFSCGIATLTKSLLYIVGLVYGKYKSARNSRIHTNISSTVVALLCHSLQQPGVSLTTGVLCVLHAVKSSARAQTEHSTLASEKRERDTTFQSQWR